MSYLSNINIPFLNRELPGLDNALLSEPFDTTISGNNIYSVNSSHHPRKYSSIGASHTTTNSSTRSTSIADIEKLMIEMARWEREDSAEGTRITVRTNVNGVGYFSSNMISQEARYLTRDYEVFEEEQKTMMLNELHRQVMEKEKKSPLYTWQDKARAWEDPFRPKVKDYITPHPLDLMPAPELKKVSPQLELF